MAFDRHLIKKSCHTFMCAIMIMYLLPNILYTHIQYETFLVQQAQIMVCTPTLMEEQNVSLIEMCWIKNRCC